MTTTTPPRRGNPLIGWLGAAAVLAAAVAAWILLRPMFDTAHFKWTAARAPDGGPMLSNTAEFSNLGRDHSSIEPTLSIVCPHGRPNVVFKPVVYDCIGDCTGEIGLKLLEEFLFDPDAGGSVYETQLRADTAPFEQDILSNDPASLTIGPPSPKPTPWTPGSHAVMQSGHWTVAGSSAVGTRFTYGADPNTIAHTYQQAHNYIERMARAKRFDLSGDSAGRGIAAARFQTSDLAAKLPAFWAACPAPSDAG